MIKKKDAFHNILDGSELPYVSPVPLHFQVENMSGRQSGYQSFVLLIEQTPKALLSS